MSQSQLNSQEQNFLQANKVAYHGKEVKTLLAWSQANNVKQWDKILSLATLVNEGIEWFNKVGRDMLKQSKGKMSIEVFLFHAYGLSKSYAYKLNKVGQIGITTILIFEAECNNARNEGYKPVLGIDALLSWHKKWSNKSSVVSDTKKEGAKSSVVSDTKLVESLKMVNKPIITVKLDNISFNVYEDLATMKQDVSIEDIEKAISKLQAFKSIVSKIQKKEAKKAHELSL